MDSATKKLIKEHVIGIMASDDARWMATRYASERGFEVGRLVESSSGKVAVIESIHPDEKSNPILAVRRILALESRDGKIVEFPKWHFDEYHDQVQAGPISLRTEFWTLDQIKRRVSLEEALND